MKRVLIDTNIYSLAMRGDSSVLTHLQQIDQIGFSSISIGELISGFKGGNCLEKNRHELNQFLDSPRIKIFPVDAETADYYAEVLLQLKKAGTPIPTNDIWIAACAFQHGYKVFTRDQHFEKIAGLMLL